MNQTINSSTDKASSAHKTKELSVGSSQSDEIALIDLLLILWKGKYIIIACTVLATVAGMIYALTAQEIFSTSTLFVTKTGGSSGEGNLDQIASLAGINLGISNNNVDPSEYLDKVIEDKNFISTLFERKWYYKGDSLPLEVILEIKPDNTLDNWEYVYFMSKLEAIRKDGIINISKDSKKGILTLTTNAPCPQLSYDLNMYTIDYLSDYIRNSLKTQAKEKRTFIEERIKETKDELVKAENALARFKERNNLSQAPQVVLEEARLMRKVSLNQEVYIQFQKQYELAKIQELDNQTLIQIVKNPEIPVKRSQPKRTLIVMVSFIGGVFMGVFGAFIWYALYIAFKKKLFNKFNEPLSF